MFRRKINILLICFLVIIVVGVLAFTIPPIRDRVVYHLNDWIGQFHSWIRPPEKVSFQPDAQSTLDLQATLTAFADQSSATSTPQLPANTSIPSPTPTATPIPSSMNLSGVTYYSQHGYQNYCAPANLAMALSYWGWKGNITDVGDAIKPYPEDKNVMPYEMANYAQSLGYGALVRVGGDADTIKRFVAAGYPVLVEKGVFFYDLTGTYSWMGHYQVITGYDNNTSMFTAQDSYIKENYQESYDQLTEEWRSFNYTYIIIYSKDRETNVINLLGADADEATNARNAYIKASNEAVQFTGVDQFYALYNVGSSLVILQDYNGAANAYDQAFAVYNTLPQDKSVRPYRILWYETGPFFAYYYTGRYQDVIDLATNNSIDVVSDNDPALEESFYWRAMAEIALNETQNGIDDLKTALHYHKDFAPAVQELNQLGVTY
ncbi:MAG TPA: C39 family peptidase [Longilinea sp.]|nr:C39 family peptidase [Longilinea sp.]